MTRNTKTESEYLTPDQAGSLRMYCDRYGVEGVCKRFEISAPTLEKLLAGVRPVARHIASLIRAKLDGFRA